MAAPILYPVNALETGGTVTATGTAVGKPLARLFDRDLGLPWEDSAAGASRIIQLQGGASNIGVNRWQMAPGHNLNGVALSLQSSPDLAAWTERDAFTPGDTTSVVDRALPLLVPLHWRWVMTTTVAAKITELILTKAVALPRGPTEGLRTGLLGNVVEHVSSAGKSWATKRGAERWFAEYDFRDLTTAERASLETALKDSAGGAKAFYLLDEDGTLRWVRWQDFQAAFTGVPVSRWDLSARFVEVLS